MTNALVTGAGSGIGRAIAERLAGDGKRVWVVDLNPESADETVQRIATAGGVALARQLDVTSAEALEALANDVFTTDGRLDVLCVNAGVSSMNHFLELTERDWAFNMGVNATGTFLTMQRFARRMVTQAPLPGREVRGKIIVTASMAARQAAPLLAHYTASKFAALGLAQAVAKELGPLGVTVNAVNPGFVKTGMQTRELEWEASLRGLTTEAVFEEYVGFTPLGRIQQPQDVANVVSFLAGSDSDFMTGAALEVNGGAWVG